MAKIVLILGSVRKNRQGIKVARWIEKKLRGRNHTVYFIDPLELDLPLLDRMYKEMTDPPQKLKDLRTKIKDAEGYMAVTPEYNRGTSAAIHWIIFWRNISSNLQLSFPTPPEYLEE
jgi:NAD(P)H-dependent FMN reductase